MAIYSNNPLQSKGFIVLLQCFLILFGFAVGSTIADLPAISHYQSLLLVWMLIFVPAGTSFLLPYYVFRDNVFKMGGLLIFFLLLVGYMATMTSAAFFNLQIAKPTTIQIATENIQFYGFLVFILASLAAEIAFVEIKVGDFRRTSMSQEQKKVYAVNRNLYLITAAIIFIAFVLYMSSAVYATF